MTRLALQRRFQIWTSSVFRCYVQHWGCKISCVTCIGVLLVGNSVVPGPFMTMAAVEAKGQCCLKVFRASSPIKKCWLGLCTSRKTNRGNLGETKEIDNAMNRNFRKKISRDYSLHTRRPTQRKPLAWTFCSTLKSRWGPRLLDYLYLRGC